MTLVVVDPCWVGDHFFVMVKWVYEALFVCNFFNNIAVFLGDRDSASAATKRKVSLF